MRSVHFQILPPGETEVASRILEAASVSHNNSPKSSEWFAWKYWTSPFGQAIVAYAEDEKGLIAGVVAFGLYELTQGQDNIKSGLSYETFVHPDYRGRSLFTKLLQSATDESYRCGLRMLFNFPNMMSLGGFVKQGWQPVNCVKSFMRPINLRNCILKFSFNAHSAPFVPDSIQKFTLSDYEGFDYCLNNLVSIRSNNVWAAVRTPEYLIWRYQTYPMIRYVIIQSDSGWAVTRIGKRSKYIEVQIMELFPSSGVYNARFLKLICKQIALKLQPDIVSLTLSQAHPIFSSMRSAGFWAVPNRANFTYKPLHTQLDEQKRAWVLTATEFHTY